MPPPSRAAPDVSHGHLKTQPSIGRRDRGDKRDRNSVGCGKACVSRVRSGVRVNISRRRAIERIGARQDASISRACSACSSHDRTHSRRESTLRYPRSEAVQFTAKLVHTKRRRRRHSGRRGAGGCGARETERGRISNYVGM